ncbi:MAG: crosslink repair DNA glycosylase YcaQ family protein [Pseudomonadota bacterium]
MPSDAALPRIDNRTARRIFLTRHGLGKWDLPPGNAGTLELIRRLGFVQVDSIATVERAHHMILWSRRRSYRPSQLATLLERDRTLFEHWTHDASVIPIEFYRYWKLRFRRDREKLLGRWRNWRREGFEERFDTMLERIRTQGATFSRDTRDPDHQASGEMWDWHPSKTAMEFLWRTGELAICHRKNFQKCFDLKERVIPEEHHAPDLPDAEIVDWACASALDRLGFATPGEIARFWDLISPAEAKEWCSRHLGKPSNQPLTEVEIQNADGTYRRHVARPDLMSEVEATPDLPGHVRVLSPFDPALRDRNRAERLFGFNYRIEIFVPEAKRQYGYYVFPVMEGDRLIGRMDAKRDLSNGILSVSTFWPEKGVKMGKGRVAKLELELERLAKFAGCREVSWKSA